MNAVARIALRLFAIYWLITGFVACGELPGEMFQFARPDSMPTIGDILSSLAVSAVVLAVIGMLPALVLLRYAGALGDRICPPSADGTDLSVLPSDLYVLGCCLLGLFFMISGLIALTSSASMLVFNLAFDSMPDLGLWRMPAATLLAASVEVGLGYALWAQGNHRVTSLPQ